MMKNACFSSILLLSLLSLTAVAQTNSAGRAQPDVGAEPAAPTPPSGEVARYVLPYYYSVTPSTGDRSVAVINVYNQSTVACNVTVEFQYATGTTDLCSITAPIPAKTSSIFCSRPVNDPLSTCFVSCPNGGLTFNEGHAFIDSTNSSSCGTLAIDAQEIFTRDAADTLVDSQSRLSIVRINTKNNGD